MVFNPPNNLEKLYYELNFVDEEIKLWEVAMVMQKTLGGPPLQGITFKFLSTQTKCIFNSASPLYFSRIFLASSVPPEMRESVTEGKSEWKERAVLVNCG